MTKILKFAPWVGLLIFAGLWLYETNKVPEVRPPGQVLKIDLPVEKRYTDSAGNEHIVVQDGKNVITKAEIKNPERPRNIIDSSAALLKIAATQIQQVTRVNVLLKDSLLKARREINVKTRQLSYRYKDPYVDLSFIPPIDTDTVGAGTFGFAYNADLNIVQYQKRKWFLGAKQSFIDISSNDPRATIMGVKQLTVRQEMPNFGLRVQASGNYNMYTNNAGFGPAVRVDLGRLSIQGNYMYYPKFKLWYPAAIVNYDIIRF